MATNFTDQDIESKLIAMGAKGASTDSLTQTMAVSKTAPGVLVKGAVTGQTAGGQGIAPVNTEIQAYSRGGSTPAPTSRYNADGSLASTTSATGTNGSSVATTTTPTNTGVGGPSPVTPNAILTPDQYKEQYGPKPIDEATIREQTRAEAQAKIDAINSIYDKMVREQNVVNEGNSGATRAINARAGLLGSDFGNANDANQRAANNKAIEAINSERGVQITAALDKVNTAVQDRIAAAKAEAAGDAASYSSYLEKAQLGAKEAIKNLGASGATVEKLKENAPDKLKELLESSGLSEFDLTLAMNAARPPAAKIDWKTDVKGNHIIVYGTDPETGKLEYHTQELPAEAAANEVKIVDGELWSVSPDGSSATKIGSSAKSEAPLTKTVGKVIYNSLDGGKTWKPAVGAAPTGKTGGSGGGGGGGAKITPAKAMQDLQSKLRETTVLGADGFMAPDDYTAIRNAWIQDGYSATTFDTSMKGYRNPNNGNYVIDKQS